MNEEDRAIDDNGDGKKEALNDDVINYNNNDKKEIDDNDDDLVGLDKVYMLMCYDTDKIGLLNGGNDGVNDMLRQYRVWENNRCDICGICVPNIGSRHCFECIQQTFIGNYVFCHHCIMLGNQNCNYYMTAYCSN